MSQPLGPAPTAMIQHALGLAIEDAVACLRRAETLSLVLVGTVVARELGRAAVNAEAQPQPAAQATVQAAQNVVAAAAANLIALCDAAAKFGVQPPGKDN
ncbi:MAG: hypothetical protein ACREHE_17410 [Rhizomicrobium sp.]